MKKNPLSKPVLTVLISIGLVLLLGLTAFVVSRQRSATGTQRSIDSTRIRVATTIEPIAFLTDRLLAEDGKTEVMVPPGYSPESYELKPQQLVALSKAELYFAVGQLPFEVGSLERIASNNPQLTVVTLVADTEYRSFTQPHDHDHETGIPDHDEEHMDEQEHGDDDHETITQEQTHEESQLDPHAWLDPVLMRQFAVSIRDELQAVSDDEIDRRIQQRWQQLDAELADLDQMLQVELATIKGKSVLVYHPAFGYLADRYGFEQLAVEVEGAEPSPAQVQMIINQARAEDITTVFVQRQFSTTAAQTIATQLNGVVVEIDPLAYDYIDNLQQIAKAVSDNKE